jgi:hypothetical protein
MVSQKKKKDEEPVISLFVFFFDFSLVSFCSDARAKRRGEVEGKGRRKGGERGRGKGRRKSRRETWKKRERDVREGK